MNAHLLLALAASALNNASNVGCGIFSDTSRTVRPCSKSYEEARQVERLAFLEANPVESWNSAGAAACFDRDDRDRSPCRLRPALDSSGNSKISPSWFSAVMRQIRRVSPLLFVECIRNPRTATGQPMLSCEKSMRVKNQRRKNLRAFIAFQREEVDASRSF